MFYSEQLRKVVWEGGVRSNQPAFITISTAPSASLMDYLRNRVGVMRASSTFE